MRMYRRIEDGMTEKKIIAIRADGNATLGMGHIMRCMSIAKAIEQASGGACVFFTAQEQTARFAEFCYKNKHAESCCADCPIFTKRVPRGAEETNCLGLG